ncbi:hypothetical protein [Enemella sp. A6]|uniref:hypothetical protein n=1 Tax=Enemella sp. A6 TaxID=3440152 RepID=UPI003EB7F73E
MALFNTDPLTRPMSREELATIERQRKEGKFGPRRSNSCGVVVIILGAAVIGFISFTFVKVWGGIASSPGGGAMISRISPFMILWLAVFAFIVARLIHRLVSRNTPKAWAKTARFAEENGLAFRNRSDNPAYPGLIFNRGHTRYSLDHVFSHTGAFADAGQYVYVTGSGDDRTRHYWNFAAFRLPRPMPHLLLDAKSNNLGRSNLSNLPVSFHKDQRVSLGAPFDDHYVLYAPEDYGTDAFFLFPPNVMQALLDATVDYDIEIIDDWMFLYTRSGQDLTDPETWRLFETIAESVVAGLSQVSQRYTDYRAQNPMAATPGQPARAIASGGQRLQTSKPVIAMVAAGGMILLWFVFNSLLF